MDVVAKRCGHPNCTKRPTYGVEGSKRAELCVGHAEEGMKDVANRRCGFPSWLHKQPTCGVEGSKA